jgi:hypothetical protein
LPETGLYVFFASPYAVEVTGAYSLGLERVNALSATEAATIAPRRLSIGGIQSARGTITPSQFERFASRRVLPQP